MHLGEYASYTGANVGDRVVLINSPDEARDAALREAERRLGAKIKRYWLSSISLEPITHGGLWNVRLELQVERSLLRGARKSLYEARPEDGQVPLSREPPRP